jgi:hypothetical protein
MAVKELRQGVARFDERAKVVVSFEEDSDHRFFEIDGASAHRGTRKRHPEGKAGFEFAEDGTAEWVFIGIDHA